MQRQTQGRGKCSPKVPVSGDTLNCIQINNEYYTHLFGQYASHYCLRIISVSRKLGAGKLLHRTTDVMWWVPKRKEKTVTKDTTNNAHISPFGNAGSTRAAMEISAGTGRMRLDSWWQSDSILRCRAGGPGVTSGHPGPGVGLCQGAPGDREGVSSPPGLNNEIRY